MDAKEKFEAFKRELGMIQTGNVRMFANWAVQNMPDYFFTIPASSTGKYHPNYALGDGGLLRHTQAAVRIMFELLGTKTFGGKYTQSQKDMMITALILHDGAKSGIPKGKYTVHNHPQIICDHIEQKMLEGAEGGVDIGLESEERGMIYSLIKSHMGEWNTGRDPSDPTLPLPKSPAQGMVHLCDYLASRKILEFNFEADL